jgi:hypothetical protein
MCMEDNACTVENTAWVDSAEQSQRTVHNSSVLARDTWLCLTDKICEQDTTLICHMSCMYMYVVCIHVWYMYTYMT